MLSMALTQKKRQKITPENLNHKWYSPEFAIQVQKKILEQRKRSQVGSIPRKLVEATEMLSEKK